MYIEKGKILKVKEVAEWLKGNRKEAIKRQVKKTGRSVEQLIEQAALELVDLNNALLKDYPVWADCCKEPKGNLDSGKHWFQIYYLGMQDNKPIKHHFWALLYMDKSKNQDYRWGFSSGAIGMSRLLASTDAVFRDLKSMGGCYAQF